MKQNGKNWGEITMTILHMNITWINYEYITFENYRSTGCEIKYLFRV